jgi:hypothetical protein
MSNATSITGTILRSLPPEAKVTRVEYEGPRIALYTTNPRFLLENNVILSDIVNTVKKRVVVRTDPEIRKKETEAAEILRSLLPNGAEVSATFFDEVLGEVILETRDPNALIKAGFDPVEATVQTGWRVKLKRAPHIESTAMSTIYRALKAAVDERKRFYRDTGDKIFRERLTSDAEVTLFTLGGFNQVGRSSFLVVTAESKILVDCGIHPGARSARDAYPRLDWVDVWLDELDAVIVSHAHLDHTGFLPVLFKYGYRGPVYCTEPTLPLMILLQSDYVKLASIEGTEMLYSLRDIRDVAAHTITLPYGLVTDVSPDVKLVFSNAGHILGSATVHLHIGEGVHNIVYTGDFKYGRTRLFDSATWNYPRAETLMIEATYGAKEDIMPRREEVEAHFIELLNTTLKNGGKVLIPVPAVGRAQEIMMVLDNYMRNGRLIEAPVFIEGMISEATALHMAYPEYLSRSLREELMAGQANPFTSEYFTVIEHPNNREEALREGAAIIMATSGMLEGGPILEYLKELAGDERNSLIFVSYQVPGTLGRRIQDGAKQVSLLGDNGKIRIVDIRCRVEKVEGFSGHSDYNQIIRYIGKLRPKIRQVIVGHGEKRKVENVARMVSRIYNVPTLSPEVQEAIKLA